VKTFTDAWERFTPFLAFPPELCRVIYTTNAIESLNLTFTPRADFRVWLRIMRLTPRSGHRLGGFPFQGGAAGEDVLDGNEEAEELYRGVEADVNIPTYERSLPSLS
jgi:mutator family transposase